MADRSLALENTGPLPGFASQHQELLILSKTSTIFLTGATGMIGGEILKRLCDEGVSKVWCLTRDKDKLAAKRRLRKRLGYVCEGEPVWAPVSGDLAAPSIAINDDLNNLIREQIDIVIHCAAETSFIKDNTCHDTNVEGTKRIIDFCRSYKRPPLLVYVSTATNCGKIKHQSVNEESGCRLDLEHFNAYTHSKAVSEALIRKSGLPYLIVRPSIVLSAGIHNEYFARQILWFMPLLHEFTRLPIDPSAKIDIVPVNFVADSIVSLLKRPRKYDCYHISAGKEAATRADDLFDMAFSFYGRPLFEFTCPNTWDRNSYRKHICSPLQRKIFFSFRYYLPFINMDVVFDNARLCEEIGSLRVPKLETYLPGLLEQISIEEALKESLAP